MTLNFYKNLTLIGQGICWTGKMLCETEATYQRCRNRRNAPEAIDVSMAPAYVMLRLANSALVAGYLISDTAHCVLDAAYVVLVVDILHMNTGSMMQAT